MKTLTLIAMVLTMCSATLASDRLNAIAQSAVGAAQEQFPKDNLKDDEVGVTIIDMRDADHLETGAFRGDAKFYPASVVKLFYLVAAQQWLEDGKLVETPELKRGMSDMIVTSNNAACQYILDAVTEAPNGHELPPEEMEKWVFKRNAVNRYFAEKGYTGINCNQKTYIDGPYGIDKVFNAGGANKNQLTSDACARLMSEIVLKRIVTPARCDAMLELLKRDPTKKPTSNVDDQNNCFVGKALSEGDKLWSKAGWTTSSRHDVAYVETEEGKLKFVLATFTNNHGNHRNLIPAMAKAIIESLNKGGPQS